MQQIETTPETDQQLTVDVIDALERRSGGANLPELARAINRDARTVRAEMLDLEAHGYVTRTGQTKGTRWHLA